MGYDGQTPTDGHVIVERAEKMLADQAAISAYEATWRIQRYARFQDLEIVDTCQGILDGDIRLLTVHETIIAYRADRSPVRRLPPTGSVGAVRFNGTTDRAVPFPVAPAGAWAL